VNRSVFRSLVVLLALPATWGVAEEIACRAPQKAMIEVDLLFGRNIRNRLGVTESRWAAFPAREVTPRFPDGLTVLDASGQWRDTQRKTIVREPRKIVRIITADADAQAKIDAIVGRRTSSAPTSDRWMP
jgi:hypothetical protein